MKIQDKLLKALKRLFDAGYEFEEIYEDPDRFDFDETFKLDSKYYIIPEVLDIEDAIDKTNNDLWGFRRRYEDMHYEYWAFVWDGENLKSKVPEAKFESPYTKIKRLIAACKILALLMEDKQNEEK